MNHTIFQFLTAASTSIGHSLDNVRTHGTVASAPAGVTPALDGGHPIALTWTEAATKIDNISRGWMYLECDEGCRAGEWHLVEHELDAFGNEEQPRSHGIFRVPYAAVEFAVALWNRPTA